MRVPNTMPPDNLRCQDAAGLIAPTLGSDVDPIDLWYPKWQFEPFPERSATVLRVLSAGSTNRWLIHSFMLTPNLDLTGSSPSEWILDETLDLERVISVARARSKND